MKREVQALLQKARDSLRAAEVLYQEGFADFCASRAYYALFYAAEALLLDRDLTFSSHSAVIAAFGKEFAKTGLLDQKYHRYLLDAQDSRNVGDYGVGPGVTDSQAQKVLGWAREFITAAEQYLSGRKE
jgi:uncharacterized protein (UPF0332 family)